MKQLSLVMIPVLFLLMVRDVSTMQKKPRKPPEHLIETSNFPAGLIAAKTVLNKKNIVAIYSAYTNIVRLWEKVDDQYQCVAVYEELPKYKYIEFKFEVQVGAEPHLHLIRLLCASVAKYRAYITWQRNSIDGKYEHISCFGG